MARKNKVSKSNELYSGMKGWEIKYLQQAEKYGHLEAPRGRGNSSKQSRRYDAK